MLKRFFFKINGLPTRDILDLLKSYKKSDISYGGDIEEEEFSKVYDYIVAYPGQAPPKIYFTNHLYGYSSSYEDYAFQELREFLESTEKNSIGKAGLGRSFWSSSSEFPFCVSCIAKWSNNRKSTDIKVKQEEKMSKTNLNPILFNVAAVFYPQYPEGAVVDLAKAEYPKIVLQPQVVLARSSAEAQTRVAAKVTEGFLDREDGVVEFFISPFGTSAKEF